jgi:hypothetical protein
MFMFFRPSGRDDPYVVAALCVDHKQHFALVKTKQRKPVFAVIFTRVDPLYGEVVTARESRLLKAHAMIAEIPRGLVVIPLETDHRVLFTRSFVKGLSDATLVVSGKTH